MTPPRLSIWAVCCGSAALACWLLAAVTFAAGVLPHRWVGRPYLDFVHWFSPGVDAPDNWALAFVYFARLMAVLLLCPVVLLVIGNPGFWLDLAKEFRSSLSE